MKKIIVPIDFSEHSEYALKVAAKLAQRHSAELLVLHMLEMSEVMLTASGDDPQKTIYFLKLAEQRFGAFLKKDYLKGVLVKPIVKHFKVFSEVNDVAKAHDADMVVMGSHGASGVKEFFVGSNTERVVRHSEIPVLVVKKELPKVNFAIVVYACDFSEESVESFVKATKLFDKINAKLHLVHVNLPNDRFKSSVEIERRVINFLVKADGHLDRLDHVSYVSDYTVEDGVLTFANKFGADLIALSTHGKKGIAHFLQGSISEDVVNHATLPVITFKI